MIRAPRLRLEPLEPRILLSTHLAALPSPVSAPSIACGPVPLSWPAVDLLSIAGAAREAVQPLPAERAASGGSAEPLSTTTYAATGLPIDVQDGGTITSSLTVPDSYTLHDVNVELSIAHTWDADLDIYLIAPDLTRIELSTGNGWSGDDYTNTVFDDSASVSITDGTAPFTGSYRPEGPLAALNGMSVQGTWQLEVTDTYVGDTGSLDGWALIVSDEPADDAYEDNDSKAIVDARAALRPFDPIEIEGRFHVFQLLE